MLLNTVRVLPIFLLFVLLGTIVGCNETAPQLRPLIQKGGTAEPEPEPEPEPPRRPDGGVFF